MPHVSDFTQAGNKIVLDLINDVNTSSLTLNDVSVELASSGEPTLHNTLATVTALPGSGYLGARNVEYNRLDIQDFVDLFYPEGLTVSAGDATHVSHLIPDVEAGLGISLEKNRDYTDFPLTPWTGEPNEFQMVTVPMLAQSLVYIGTLAFKVDADDIQLEDIISSHILNGLNLPVEEEYILPSQLVFNAQPLEIGYYNGTWAWLRNVAPMASNAPLIEIPYNGEAQALTVGLSIYSQQITIDVNIAGEYGNTSWLEGNFFFELFEGEALLFSRSRGGAAVIKTATATGYRYQIRFESITNNFLYPAAVNVGRQVSVRITSL